MKTGLKPGRRYIGTGGSVSVRVHPLWALARYPLQNIVDLWYHRNPLRWFRYGNWRYSTRILPGEHATSAQIAALDQKLAAMRDKIHRAAQKTGE